MYCVYWKITGPPVPVLRGVWMYDQVLTLLLTLFRPFLFATPLSTKNRPVGGVLSQELETAYL